jgi:hypothetical protein
MFTIQIVENLKWDNLEHTSFTCDVKYEEFDEKHPTGVNLNDKYLHIKNLWLRAINGEFGEIKEFSQ